ncbi:methyltransferase domain-containing protein [Elioraea sp.]|uniref:methyltransferase domain-containing protein n=1 Tax=Elioraea sp. TaxID=2185103 RepID=UPI003F702342
MSARYVHGYEATEAIRLQDQAQTLEHLLHADTVYPVGDTVLEAGCGVGAQTLPLARNSPGAHVTAVDVSATSLAEAERRVREAGHGHVTFRQADILALPFAPASFDHVFACFVLEHLPRPREALAALGRVLKPGGTITVIEGDHGSALIHPRSDAAEAAIGAQVALQRMAGGDALVGRQLFPLLGAAGFVGVQVSPRLVYVDASRPALVDGFIRRTFTAMIAGVRAQAIRAGIIEAEVFDAGIRALLRTAEADGVFCYTFFKATARRAA